MNIGQTADKASVTFTLTSPDGDQGYPGALDVTATYAVEGNALSLEFEARSTKPTEGCARASLRSTSAIACASAGSSWR